EGEGHTVEHVLLLAADRETLDRVRARRELGRAGRAVGVAAAGLGVRGNREESRQTENDQDGAGEYERAAGDAVHVGASFPGTGTVLPWPCPPPDTSRCFTLTRDSRSFLLAKARAET